MRPSADVLSANEKTLKPAPGAIQDFFKMLGDRYLKTARIDPGFPAWYSFFDPLTSDAAQVTEETFDFLTEIMNGAVDE
ncbi:hypothetical protein [Phaeobacter gallaeciensis]|uniref:hypothetical protein n=2 Tax=Phaeobacter gallaeciensis TaxID=60890 RepID=UPI00237FCC88|nr:hypothetical protein [Phaeobacter gallaeciensis]